MRHKELIDRMSLEEKAALLSGKAEGKTRGLDRFDIMPVQVSEGVTGIRPLNKENSENGELLLSPVCFPAAGTVANSWDEFLANEIGKALGKEAVERDVHVLLGPGINILRNPLWGKSSDNLSEDPYLSGKMAAAYIHGIQRQGIYACPKVYGVYSQELEKMSVDAILDERTLREIYLTGFEIAIKEGRPKAILTASNKVNGIPVSENFYLLRNILRKEWGFDGIVITDQGGCRDVVRGVLAGVDLEMPSPGLNSARKITKAVKDGRLSEEIVNEGADRILDAAITLTENITASEEADFKEYRKLARKAAVESAVLLKNDSDILPLRPETRVAVIGDLAFVPRYQNEGKKKDSIPMLETLVNKIGEYNFIVTGTSRGYLRNDKRDMVLEKEAEELAEAADVVLYCFGLPELNEPEECERMHMRLPQNQICLLEKIFKVNQNIIGILNTGSPVEMPWLSCLKALIYGGLNGQAGAGAMLDLVSGKVNPSGKLSETWPVQYEDTPSLHYYPGTNQIVEYRESIFTGYRYYDTVRQKVLFPFGYGLSYTRFEYRDIWVEEKGVGFTLANIGDREGAEIVQMYVGRDHSKIFRPEKELKGFRKVFLKAGESRTVWFQFDDKTFRYWNVLTNNWEVEAGQYRIMIGGSSADIRLTVETEIQGTTEEYPYDGDKIPSYYTGEVKNISNDEFAALTEASIPHGRFGNDLTLEDTPGQMYHAKSFVARYIWKRLIRKINKKNASDKSSVRYRKIMNMPFYTFAKNTDGAVSEEMMEGILLMVNGCFRKGLSQTIKEYVRNKKQNTIFQKKLRERNKDIL